MEEKNMPGLGTLADKIKSNPIAATLLIIGGSLLFGIFWFISRDSNLKNLEENGSARGLITFLIAFVTVSIAIVLTLYVAVSDLAKEEVKERFSMGKEVFTALVGILGTIVGFYFGAAKETGQPPQQGQPAVAQVQISPVKLSGDQLIKGQSPITLETKITGGTPPYSYTILFEPKNLITEITEKSSPDGNIKEELKIAEKLTANGEVTTVQIDIKDAKGKTASSKDDQKKIPVKIQ
jgi:hypothetical protein